MKKNAINCLFLLFFILFLGSCFRSRPAQQPEVIVSPEPQIAEEIIAQEVDADFGKIEMTIEERKTGYLALLEQEQIYFLFRDDHGDNVNRLFTVSVENSFPIMFGIDFIDGVKTNTFQRIMLNDYLRNSDSFWHWHRFTDDDFAFVRRENPRHSITNNVLFFRTRDGIIQISARLFGSANPPKIIFRSINFDEIIAELSSSRKESQIRYTGLFEFHRLEVMEDTGNLRPRHNSLHNPVKNISIRFTEVGNLHMQGIFADGSICETFGEWFYEHDGIFFYIRNHETPVISIFSANGGGMGGHAFYRFQDDYLIFHYSFGGRGQLLEYRIYYRRVTNGT